MKIEQIIIKDYTYFVLRVKVKNLNYSQLSTKFLDNYIKNKIDEVFIKCDHLGNIDYRGKRKEYRTFSVDKYNII